MAALHYLRSHFEEATEIYKKLLIENKDGGPTMALRNVTLDRVARNGNLPVWIEGQSHRCAGATLDVQVEDDRDRPPVADMGDVSDMRGAVRVRNAAISRENCKATQPLPAVEISCNSSGRGAA